MRYYNPYKTNTIFDDVKWKWNDTELGIGVYVSFLHGNAEIRKNDNPPTNPVQLQKSFREDLPDTGSGSDFSAFYKGDPLFPQSRFNYEDTKEVVRRLSGTKCAQTEAWVANEGFYKWDYETNEWTPIYYMPWNTDFYY
ncbi:unnamed protein product [Heligmosomoides polygyrus]|uniref:Chromo domain-containing protein n=1 Tax=Heligmosomoides polygyrus TaxID=6339 RepID=A0A183G3Y8_HELPZ|nr:unnamed protein product [Heligmosomoides polygyrus]